jgi:hypothetical protein
LFYRQSQVIHTVVLSGMALMKIESIFAIFFNRHSLYKLFMALN